MSEVYCEGLLLKRQRGLHAANAKKLKFQERFFRLTPTALDYYDPNPRKRGEVPKGQFAVSQIKIVELTTAGIFGREFPHAFQVGDQTEVMYFVAKSQSEKEQWLAAFRQAAVDAGNSLLSYCHKGVFGLVNRGRWSCCANTQRTCHGCSRVTIHTSSASFEPSLLPAVKDDRSKSLNFELDDSNPFVPSSYSATSSVFGDDEALPMTPVVRSFTMSQPRNVTGAVLQKIKEKRITADLDCIRPDAERQESELQLLKPGEPFPAMEEEEGKLAPLPPFLGKKSDELGELSKIAQELHGGNTRSGATSPSGSSVADSGRGTSTSSSRPNSQVLPLDNVENGHISSLTIETKCPASSIAGGEIVTKEGEGEGEEEGEEEEREEEEKKKLPLKKEADLDEPDGPPTHSSKSPTQDEARTPTEKTDKEFTFEEKEMAAKPSPPAPRKTSSPRLLDNSRSQDGRSLDSQSLDSQSLDGQSLDGRSQDGSNLSQSQDGRSQDRRSQDVSTLTRVQDGWCKSSPTLARSQDGWRKSSPTLARSQDGRSHTRSPDGRSQISATLGRSPGMGRKVAMSVYFDPVGQTTGDNKRPSSTMFGDSLPSTPTPLHRTSRPMSMMGGPPAPVVEEPREDLFHVACRIGNLDLLIEELNSDGINLEEQSAGPEPHTPLYSALRHDHFQVMTCLLERGASPNSVDPSAKTTPLHAACSSGYLEVVELLLKYNADVNGKDFNGVTPLLEACRQGHDTVAHLLLRSGADCNHEGGQLRTALHEVALLGNATIAEMLLREGADPIPRDSDDLTPFDLAFGKDHMEVMHLLRGVIPEEVRPYSFLRSKCIPSQQFVTSLAFRGTETLISGSRDCHASYWDTASLSVSRCLKLCDTVLSLDVWQSYMALGSTSIQLVDMSQPDRRRTIADDAGTEDESLENPPLHLVAFGPKGCLATAGVESNIVKLWPPPSPRSGIVVSPYATIAVATEQKQLGCIYSLSLSPSPNFRLLAVGVQPGPLFEPEGFKLIYLIDYETRVVQHIFDAGDGGLSVSVHCLFTPNGQQLAIGCSHNLCIWDCKTGDLLYKFNIADATISSLCFSPGGSHLSAGLSNGGVKVFSIVCHGCIFSLKKPKNPSAVTALAYSNDSKLFATGHQNGDLQLWEVYVGLTAGK